ncbi:hypothetical protein A0H81_00723 [Grifola frondosa]|uniref:Uncharacterized protein n=1 Tax=Grifola frondosa TaxID=5627 RepID=A0A1C7MSP2_GRIFR|nr:hypothetical protein A0H81_00723 [Grifola frondosa]
MPRSSQPETALASASASARKKESVATRNGAVAKTSSPRISNRRKPRKPKENNTILPSNLRPHVLARDRLARWSTPFATEFRRTSSSLLSLEASVTLYNVMLSSLDIKTQKNYGAGLLRFTQFCDGLSIPETLRMPAPEPLLAAFIAKWSGAVARTTIDNWLAGLSFWHAINGAPWQGNKMLRVTSVYAIACTAFWCCRRLGELVIPSPNTFDADKHVAKSAGIRYRKLLGQAEYAVFHIPWTKTTKHAGADIIATGNDEPTSPLTALRHHQNANSRVPSTAPMFAFETSAYSALIGSRS